MKAAPFAYVRPGSVAGAVAALAETGAKVIAGGQSLVPLLAMRLARPSALIDINAIPELHRLMADDAAMTVCAAVGQRQVQMASVTRRVPLLRLALPWVGHREIRSRGTVCGSLAHADPAAELPAVSCCLSATITVEGPEGSRTANAEDFFTGAMTTSLRPGELIRAVRFPFARAGEGFGFAEVARRFGDFALAGVAAMVRAADPEHLTARLVAFGVSDTPMVADVSAALGDAARAQGPDIDPTELTRDLAPAAEHLAEQVVTTGGDQHGSAEYRRRLVSTLAAQQLSHAYLDATQPPARGSVQ